MLIRFDEESLPPLQAGDVVFLSGHPEHTDPPPFEHVALVARHGSPETADDFQNLKVYGLPESIERAKQIGATTLVPCPSKRWYYTNPNRPPGTPPRMGHPERIWSFAVRTCQDPYVAAARMLEVAHLSGYTYEDRKIDAEVREWNGERFTHCIGFVCEILTHRSRNLPALAPRLRLSELFPVYVVPLSDEYAHERESAYVGHLAQALARNDEEPLAYGHNFTREQAEDTALAKAFLRGMRPNGP